MGKPACLFRFSPAFVMAVAASLVCGASLAAERSLRIDDFEHGLRKGWGVKRFKDATVYTVVREGSGHVLRAESNAAASALIFKIEYALDEYPILTWRWKVENTISGGDETRKSGDDYAARVYVVFPGWVPSKTRSVNYIWANRLPRDAHAPNPFFAGAVMLAAESGPARVGTWVTERRNVLQDYRRIFGEDPPRAGALALMTDTDNTGGSAVAYYDDSRLERDDRGDPSE
ncbi:MAG: DUF3047 domain-containing protein [Deltaproteobacteria bacterium]|nr:DUF3047 domain-containing protein [Deltaproteobacteria bacterium]